MDRLADFRRVFAQVVVARAGCVDPAILAAFERIPRHEFIGPGPWYFSEERIPTPSADPALLYQDIAMALAPERGITTGQPSLHARCFAACAIKPGERVMHIGTGSGYFAAILAELVGESGDVLGLEIDEALAAKANENLRAWPWARVEHRSGADNLSSGADLVYVCAAVQQLPLAWLGALRAGGRLVFPLTPAGGLGGTLLVRHIGSPQVFTAEFICRSQFIPCDGTQDDDASSRLTAAFAAGTHGSVRSLRLHPEEPDGSAWFAGRGFWLSTVAAPASCWGSPSRTGARPCRR